MPNTDETLPTPPADPNATLARPDDAPAGALAIPGYDLLPKIAEGGMGVVYRARDLTFDREVAIKVMKPGMNAAEFVREAKVTARLPHPGIPPVYAMGALPDGRPFLAMKLIQGETLDAVLQRRTEYVTDRGKLLAAFEQMCHAVGYAHAQGLIHRDLKPSNVMVGAFGEVQVMDWGLAKETRSAERETQSEEPTDSVVPSSALRAPSFQETVAGQIKGTPAYMAPEQARGEPVDARADVFALGGILAAILTNHPPFAGNSVLDTILRAAQAELSDTFARLSASGADADLLTLCKKSLAPKAEERFTDATELALAVAAHRAEVEARLVRAERERAAAEERRKRRRAQWALAASVLLLVVAGGVGAAFASLWHTADTERDAADVAKNDALNQKKIADSAKDIAQKAQVAEEVARKQVEEERQKLAVVEYGRTVQVAQQECLTNNQLGARALLDSTPQEFRKWEWNYVSHLTNFGLLQNLTGHTDQIAAATFSPDGSRIVTASRDNTARVWNARTGEVLLTLKGHRGPVRSVSYNSDGTRIVTGSDDSTARVWDAQTGAERLIFQKHNNPVLSAKFSPDGARVVTGGDDNKARIWNAETGEEIRALPSGDNFAVLSAAFHPDGTQVVTASGYGAVRVWEVKTGTELRRLNGHTTTVHSASFSADGTRIVTASNDATARVWDAKTGTELLTLKGHLDPLISGGSYVTVRAASFSPDGARVVTGGEDKTARIWDANTGAELLTLRGHTSYMSSVSFSPDGTRIVTGNFDGTAKVWDAKTGPATLTLKGHSNRLTSASFNPDGNQVVTSSEDGTAKVWDAKTGSELRTLKGHNKTVWSASFCPNGTNIVTASTDGTARVWEARTGAERLRLMEKNSIVRSASFSSDGTRIVTGNWSDQTARVWDAQTGSEQLVLKFKNYVWAASFNPERTRILTGDSDKTARVWDAKTGTPILTLNDHPGSVLFAVFSPDGTRICTHGEQGVPWIWDAQTGTKLLTLKGHIPTETVWSAAFSPDGLRLVSGSNDCTAKVWDAKTGAELLTLKGHTSRVSSVAFSPDGTRIVTSSFDRTAKVWDARTGTEKAAWYAPLPVAVAPAPRAK